MHYGGPSPDSQLPVRETWQKVEIRDRGKFNNATQGSWEVNALG